MLAPKLRLGNLVGILDNNHVQMCGTTDEILGLGDVKAKFEAFGWNVIQVNGHDIQSLIDAFDSIPDQPDGRYRKGQGCVLHGGHGGMARRCPYS